MADYLEFGELLALDALHRTECCGGHFREESQTPEGEALRDDEQFSYVAAWEFSGLGEPPVLHQEELVWETCIRRRGATSRRQAAGCRLQACRLVQRLRPDNGPQAWSLSL